MTKTEMLDFIEKTGMIIDFDRNYLMKKTKARIVVLYNRAVVYAGKAWAAALVRLRCNTSNYSIDKFYYIYYNIDNERYERKRLKWQLENGLQETRLYK